MPRPIFLSGRVLFDDGSKPSRDIVIQRVCMGNPRPEGYTDSKGHFSFQLGQTRRRCCRMRAQARTISRDSIPGADRARTRVGWERAGNARSGARAAELRDSGVVPGIQIRLRQPRDAPLDGQSGYRRDCLAPARQRAGHHYQHDNSAGAEESREGYGRACDFWKGKLGEEGKSGSRKPFPSTRSMTVV